MLYKISQIPDNTLNVSFIPDINIAAFAAGYNKLMLRALHRKKKQTDLK